MSTIKAVVAPRSLLEKLAARPEVKRAGVYLLVGDDPQIAGRRMVYVGEGDETLSRLTAHSSDESKAFFDTVYVFCSKDENLTKAHGRWLEARLVTRLTESNRCTVANKVFPVGGALPESDVAEMTEYLDQLQLLASALGLNVFEATDAKPKAQMTSEKAPDSLRLRFYGEGYDATCELRDGTFVVRKGSRARLNEATALPSSARNTRAELLSTAVVASDGANLVFQNDYEFASASGAAQVICGFSINGWTAWKLEDGTSLSDWQEKRIAVTDAIGG
jgi:hypothetical protein